MRIFLSGIGGIGMSAYAALMKHAGHEVSGSDKSDSDTILDLRSQGIDVSLIQDGSSVPEGCDLFVYSEAIPEHSPERLLATSRGIPQQSYFQALGNLAQGKKVIAVCGTHGKSSTTAMIAKVFMDAGKDPSVVVGTKMPELGRRNWRAGSSDLWIVEACEYRRSFLHLSPTLIVVTTTDGDHFDAFKDLRDYRNAFAEFFAKLPLEGSIVCHGSDLQTLDIAQASGRHIVDADAEEMPSVGVPGDHMRQNARLAAAVARHEGIGASQISGSLSDFRGTWRRMEERGVTSAGAVVIDDYAHHPLEIRSTIQAMKEKYPSKNLVCVFEPHTNDRTLKLWDDFIRSFRGVSRVLVTDVYDARPDKDTEKADTAKLAQAIAATSTVTASHSGAVDETVQILKKELGKNDVALVMGAGKSTVLAGKLLAT